MCKKLSVGECDIVVAVIGNPNVGKSTLFNALTGKAVHVANWPGVTVARSEGRVCFNGKRICFVDLPGIYGLSSDTPEALVSIKYLLSNEPDVILVVTDALAPERSFYLPLQILEITDKVVIALNKIDAAHSSGIHLRIDALSKELGVPVVPVSALKNMGFRELLKAIVEVHEKGGGKARVCYGVLENYICRVEDLLRRSGFTKLPTRWAAIQALSGSKEVLEEIRRYSSELADEIERVRDEFIDRFGRDPGEAVVSERYRVIEDIMSRCVVRRRVSEGLSKVDRVFLNPVLGPIASLAVILSAFFIVFSINTGFPLSNILEYTGHYRAASFIESYSLSGLLGEGFSRLGSIVGSFLESHGHVVIASLVRDGIIAGVGAVLSFLPLIMMAYAILGALEDVGLASRVALSFDSILRRFGYTGKSVFPFVLSLGCNVPGVMACRALEGVGERLLTIMTAPLIPCQARLVVLMAFAAAFMSSGFSRALSIAFIYLISFVLVLLLAPVLRRVLKLKAPAELAIEIPPLHKPSLRVVWWHTWDNSVHFVRKAGTVIFALSIVSWFLLNYNAHGFTQDPSNSFASMLGKAFAPLLSLYGLSGESAWKVAYAFENGFIAKEGVLEAIALLNPASTPIDSLKALNLTPPQAIALMTTMSLYVPCIATMAVIYSETRSLKTTLLVVAYMITLSIIVSLAVYRVASII